MSWVLLLLLFLFFYFFILFFYFTSPLDFAKWLDECGSTVFPGSAWRRMAGPARLGDPRTIVCNELIFTNIRSNRYYHEVERASKMISHDLNLGWETSTGKSYARRVSPFFPTSVLALPPLLFCSYLTLSVRKAFVNKRITDRCQERLRPGWKTRAFLSDDVVSKKKKNPWILRKKFF